MPKPGPVTVTVGLEGLPPKVTPSMVGVVYETVPLKVVPSTVIEKLSPVVHLSVARITGAEGEGDLVVRVRRDERPRRQSPNGPSALPGTEAVEQVELLTVVRAGASRRRRGPWGPEVGLGAEARSRAR